ncbi:helix-turn-helix domain-containing protein [Nocardia sp. NPDC051570]|uniref:helix-turn-helix domain-containing protein n=1 Tax=Nocardia sp. NPDC051570 TaxID=3364324 RepID=UPI0037A3DEE3
MTHPDRQAREALGARLREIRKNAGFTARALAVIHGWPRSKMSKIELGRQTPSETDVNAWCRSCDAVDQIPDLIATLRNIETAYLETRRMRLPVRQRQSINWEAETKLMRWYEPWVVPGLLQTPAYAEALLGKVLDFYHGSRSDLEAMLAARMERQQVLYRGDHRFHFVIAEQVLHTTIGDNDAMVGQLDRLLIAMTLPRVVLGVVPLETEYVVPQSNFCMFDRRRVLVETITAELTITQPRELVLYEKTFQTLAEQAVVGNGARELIRKALESRSG